MTRFNTHVEDHGTHVTIHTPDPFSYQQVVAYLNRSENECLHRVDGATVYKAIPINTEIAVMAVSNPTPSRIEIRLLESGGCAVSDALLAAARYVWEWFDLDANLVPFYQLATGDPVLKTLVTDYYGLRLIGVPDLFEALCWAVMGQQINLAFAYTLKRRFVEAFGTRTTVRGHTYWIFPDACRISELTPSELTALGFTTRKSEYLAEIARWMRRGAITKQGLLALPDLESVVDALTDIRGVGKWTANYVAMRCLRHRSAFPIDDVGLHHAVSRLLGMNQKPTREELGVLFAPWHGYEAYATFYFWRHLLAPEY
ncbi:DNA-3-methyladenine glycosylase [Alicyclobacillus fastidiosus]|uniref:DNA-3-methyladenine glycosylase II n=1 Tax=Alicyclobacillus fastidiosus TaxID=392011 RepID=A0ABY6ZC21_9BACL|nr:DNA-3-methyladenine glycosylase [Alicyclobacillus fastidiosus]WAH40083.1 DNA-3-methyladenine glycosylase [Alicyclobacillus fastidiosus]GMA61404.1 DNA-3-methyladenine glycosylase [Alicyclobacillus fastidiosus]